MKRIYSLLLIVILFSASCSEDHADLLLEGNSANAATLSLALNETSFNLNNLSEQISFDVASTSGGTVSSVDVMIGFGTESPVNLGNYSIGQNIAMSATEAYAKVSKDVANAAAGDTFSFTFLLNMASGAVTRVPNIVQASVICKIPDTFGVGAYTYQPLPGYEFIFGAGPQDVTLSLDPETSTRRVISELTYVAPLSLGNPPLDWTIDLICGDVFFVPQRANASCGDELLVGPADTPGSFNLSSDTIKVTLFDAYDGADGGCGFGPDLYEFLITKETI